ncbi:hypothetical protein K2173_023481 [Erythroxylum novogranatense]|uniref:Uncharacterized protein n=1 Tax=Erythroxylum novogranatense TaxID=1862640 RepID=A0AAV8TW02_9ROSI|nr:hypothetical protein K2173_023481 [Erythroxylum novogranatense]
MAEEQTAVKEERSTGRVVMFSDKKGFGFIKPDDGDEDLFVHHSAIKSDGSYRTLSEDDVVEFTVALSDNKYQAINVTAPGGGPVQHVRSRGGRGGGFGPGWGRRSNGAGSGASAGGCYNCGNTGHIARDCRGGDSTSNGCFKCGSAGHFARDCSRVNGGGGPGSGISSGGGGACFNCGGYGHMARDCPGGGGACYNCGGYGHMARECTSGRGINRFGGGGGCFNCGNEGHFARDCPDKS